MIKYLKKNQIGSKIIGNLQSSISKLIEYLILGVIASPIMLVIYANKVGITPEQITKTFLPFDIANLIVMLLLISAFFILIKEVFTNDEVTEIFENLEGEFDEEGNYEGSAQISTGQYRVNMELIPSND